MTLPPVICGGEVRVAERLRASGQRCGETRVFSLSVTPKRTCVFFEDITLFPTPSFFFFFSLFSSLSHFSHPGADTLIGRLWESIQTDDSDGSPSDLQPTRGWQLNTERPGGQEPCVSRLLLKRQTTGWNADSDIFHSSYQDFPTLNATS